MSQRKTAPSKPEVARYCSRLEYSMFFTQFVWPCSDRILCFRYLKFIGSLQGHTIFKYAWDKAETISIRPLHRPTDLESQSATVQSSEQVAKVRESKKRTQLTQSSCARSIELTRRRVKGSNSSTLLCSHAAARMDLKLKYIHMNKFVKHSARMKYRCQD